jgi:hypothetical protein
MSVSLAFACGLMLWCGSAQAGNGGAESHEAQASIERDLALLDQLDAMSLASDYADARLSEVAADLSSRLPVPLVLDRESLRAIGVREDDRMTLQLGAIAVSSLLDALTRELASGLDQPMWEVHRGAIVLTSKNGTEALRSLAVYDVRDLVADAVLLGELRATRPAIPVAEDDDGNGVEADEDGEEGDIPVISKAHELLLIILEHLDPDAWVDMGGSLATITEHQSLVMVTAPGRLHRQFRDALRRLRDSQAHSLRLQVQVVDLPRTTFDRLSRQYQHEGELAVALSRGADASVRWQATGTVATGSTLALSSTSDDKSIEVDVKATYDRAAGQLHMEIKAKVANGADRREASTTVQFQLGEGAAILELAPAEVSETARVVVVRPM